MDRITDSLERVNEILQRIASGAVIHAVNNARHVVVGAEEHLEAIRERLKNIIDDI